jgi:hypothetical protein
MNLSKEHWHFLEKEFGLTKTEVMSMDIERIKNLREKCFDIEVEEAVIADYSGFDTSQRGSMAVEIVDLLLGYLRSEKALAS